MNFPEDFINSLSRIDTLDLVKKIANFRNISLRELSEAEIFQELLNVLLNDGKFSYITNIGKYTKGTQIFRVRKLLNISLPLREVSIESDFWNPPVEYVTTFGRLHKPGESLLYTSPINPKIALKEMKIVDGDWFVLIVYDALQEIKGNIIGGKYDYELGKSLMKNFG